MARNSTPIRRAQLVAPFGVGAMLVSPEGIAMMPTGLDHWFEREASVSSASAVDEMEFRVDEWRLQKFLGVGHFMLPPDFRQPWRFSGETKNLGLTIPCVRFPQWHFCQRCRILTKLPLTQVGPQSCSACHAKNKKGRLAQVQFVAMCEVGHIQDFPWREWVHHSIKPSCNGTLTLTAAGGASLAAQVVECSCKAKRTLGGVTEASAKTTTLTSTLSDDDEYVCSGHMPWHGVESATTCGEPLRGSLRSASNVYFATMRSAIYLPRESNDVPAALIAALEAPHIAVYISSLHDTGQEVKATYIRNLSPEFADYEDEQIQRAINITLGIEVADEPAVADIASDDAETRFRRAEFSVLRTAQKNEQLSVKPGDLETYGDWVAEHFDRVLLVDKLRETRALVGFERLNPEPAPDFAKLKSLLRTGTDADWLPAYLVYGEGIFLELNAEKLQEWERQPRVLDRVGRLAANYVASLARRQKAAPPAGTSLTARGVLLHTLAHVFMNRLTFESGYSSAALRERLYISTDASAPMAAVLIYTAAGDAEGTMGGLVRMGKPERLGTALKRSVDEARWCSTDPVCMEVGDQGGQGPESCNLAACHNCALVPETACENFNRFLDRGLLVGQLDDPSWGFFA